MHIMDITDHTIIMVDDIIMVDIIEMVIIIIVDVDSEVVITITVDTAIIMDVVIELVLDDMVIIQEVILEDTVEIVQEDIIEVVTDHLDIEEDNVNNFFCLSSFDERYQHAIISKTFPTIKPPNVPTIYPIIAISTPMGINALE
jgi:hypothetical protein